MFGGREGWRSVTVYLLQERWSRRAQQARQLLQGLRIHGRLRKRAKDEVEEWERNRVELSEEWMVGWE
jgi:hypothetical protein